jgi:CheY-like chemotaxis protein
VRFLAVYESPEAQPAWEALQKLSHTIEHVSKRQSALDMLEQRTFDAVLCQTSLEADDCNVFDLIKDIRKSTTQPDIPIICFCATESRANLLLDADMVAMLTALGAQGYLDRETFQSVRLMQEIEKCLRSAIGGECKTTSLYG